jgi:adenylyltransferase and sulfurtransferase
MFVIIHSSRFAIFLIQKVSPKHRSPKSIDIPFSTLIDDAESALADISREKPVFVVCRFGNDSQLAVNTMKSLDKNFIDVKDLKGGLDAWAEAFPTDIIPKY